jgi:AraC family transcriptional regulator
MNPAPAVPESAGRVARSQGVLRLAPGQFFGGARLSFSSHGIDVSHRIAVGAPEEVLTHTHEDAHFILVTGGDYVSAAGARPSAGQVLVYNPPGTTHRDHFESGRGSFLAISVQPRKAAALLAAVSIADEPLYLPAAAQHAIAMRIAGSWALGPEGLSLEALCLELLASMERGVRSPTLARPPWLNAALELLHDRYTEELTIADIAGSVGVHPIHLARTFRRHFRCTPGEFARYRRLERAVALLGRTARPLAEVALSSGFADQSHFSKTFTRYFGLPPGEYRLLAGQGVGPSRRFQIDKTALPRWNRVTAWATAARAGARRRMCK